MVAEVPTEAAWMLGVGVLSWWLTGRVRAYAQARSLVDVPNARSSHALPTPRGGGLAIVVAFFVAVVVLRIFGLIGGAAMLALLIGGGLVALTGFVDDHEHIPARWRLLMHFVAAVVVLWLQVPTVVLDSLLPGAPSYLAYGLAGLFLIWMLNLYNFMDGIDGIAGVEAVTTCLAGGVMLWGAGADGLAWLAWVLALSVAGFLVWNFPPARIFMGDVGSGFLGMTLGVLAMMSAAVDVRLFWAWIILLAVFVSDATVTLVRRALRGERVHEAHRSHAYQRAARRFGSHARVTLATGGVNLLWLSPIAYFVVAGAIPVVIGLLSAYGPLVVSVWRFGAGLPEDSTSSRTDIPHA